MLIWISETWEPTPESCTILLVTSENYLTLCSVCLPCLISLAMKNFIIKYSFVLKYNTNFKKLISGFKRRTKIMFFLFVRDCKISKLGAHLVKSSLMRKLKLRLNELQLDKIFLCKVKTDFINSNNFSQRFWNIMVSGYLCTPQVIKDPKELFVPVGFIYQYLPH